MAAKPQPPGYARKLAHQRLNVRTKKMCYMVYISTDCKDDISALTSDLVRFEKPSAERQAPCPQILKHEHKWFVGSKSGCSCTFRHLCRESVELGFSEPLNWFPEEAVGIDATHGLYAILNDLVQRGCQVDLLDCWSGDEDEDAVCLDVSLSQVPVGQFRMFEGHLFNLKQ